MKNNLKFIHNCEVGQQTVIQDFVNLYDCKIGDSCKIGPFVEIQKNVVIGNRVKIGSHSFICEGVTIQDNVFVGHHVVFTNDKYPRATNESGELKAETDWDVLKTKICENSSIGSNSTLVGGITIGKNSIVGAGSVVVDSVPDNVIVAGNPAKILRKLT